jgi:O-methyltransferase
MPTNMAQSFSATMPKSIKRFLKPIIGRQSRLYGAIKALRGGAETAAVAETNGAPNLRITSVTAQVRACYPDIVEEEFWAIADKCLPCTLTQIARLYALYKATEYVQVHKIPGAIVECGVWLGGSVMAAAETLHHLGCADREFYLFDTFTGMTAPTKFDVDMTGVEQSTLSEEVLNWPSCIEQTKANLRKTPYPFERFHFLAGPVEETIPGGAPGRIALLRLDTDWYESTRHELEHLYPRLVSGGVLIIDDYGHFRGARKAVDEYFALNKEKILFQRVDYTARVAIKP